MRNAGRSEEGISDQQRISPGMLLSAFIGVADAAAPDARPGPAWQYSPGKPPGDETLSNPGSLTTFWAKAGVEIATAAANSSPEPATQRRRPPATFNATMTSLPAPHFSSVIAVFQRRMAHERTIASACVRNATRQAADVRKSRRDDASPGRRFNSRQTLAARL